MLKMNVYKETGVRLPVRRLEKLFARLTAQESRPGSRGQVNLVFTDDRAIRRLNKAYLGKDTATDVLSFSVDTPDSPSAVFGEVYISCPTAARQAVAYGATPGEEFLRLTCHGLLHLFGYDHILPRQAKTMQVREQRYLRGA